MFTTHPQIRREAIAAFDATSLVDGEQADYSVSYYSVEVPLYRAKLLEDKRKNVTKVERGETVLLYPKVSLLVKKRLVMVEAHARLYESGAPVFKRMYRHGDIIVDPIVWTATETFDLTTVPYLYEVYIVDQHFRGTPL